MRSNIALAFTALPVIVAAHADPRDVYAAVPRMVGGNRQVWAEMTAAMKERGLLDLKTPAVPEKKSSMPAEDLAKRQSTTTCGPGIGSCEAGLCCSLEGYCGVGSDYCSAPDCQISYGPACDANIPPSGTTTSTIARPVLGSVPYGGAGIYDCTNAGDVALTFDDGPYIYTEHILDILDEYDAKATFMITGNNLGKGQIDNVTTGYPALIQRMITSGHQIASHTWGHQNFTALSLEQFQNEVYYNEMAFRNILGFFPTYLRPPYSECNDTCGNLLGEMGYHITYFDLDTQDYLNDATNLIQNSKNFFTEGMEKDDGVPCSYENYNHLVIGHDIHYQTAYNLTQFMLDYLKTNNYGTSVTVGQCLGDPAENWYRAAGSAIPSAQPTTSLGACAGQPTPAPGETTSPDNTCGPANDYSCIGTAANGGGDCCSVNGYCGSTDAYCGTGCQAAYGLCGTNATSSETITSTTSTPTSTSTSSSATSTSTLTVSPDNTCGGTTGYTCIGVTASNGGTCCSAYGYCGSTSAYCGTGCQIAFGTCST